MPTERTATRRKTAITAISQSDWPGLVTKDGRWCGAAGFIAGTIRRLSMR